MRIDIFTLFPAMLESPLQESILKRAQDSGRLAVAIHNIRDYTSDRHRTADDAPYGGGGGMVMKPEPIFAAVESVLGTRAQGLSPASPTAGEAMPAPSAAPAVTPSSQLVTPIVLLSPQGRLFTQETARELARHERLALICGRYEGVDERVRLGLATDELSIGDYVLTGGELPAMVVVDAVARLLPGVLGDADAVVDDSHAAGLLEYPHYTRPPEFRGLAVPEVLVSGDHARLARWRREQSLRRTWERRPDLLRAADLTEADRRFLATLGSEAESADLAE